MKIRRPQGFTMIELIVVIVILGVLAATALPKFIDMNSDAKAAALKGVVGAAASAMTINYSGCAVAQHAPATGKCVKVDDCDDLGSIMQGGLPSGYTITAAAITAESTVTNCVVTGNGKTANFTATGIS